MVEEATRKGDEIHKQVQEWLDSVNNMIEEATDIIEDNKRQNMLCFKSLCPDLKKRYQQSKIAWMKTDDVSKLHNEGTFERVSYRTLPAETWLPDSYENIKSRHSTMEGILNALQDRDVNMIGVHGMGGSGKTTLVREVAKKAEEEKLFNQVVFAEVSDTVDIRKIQGVIAERLGLKFHEDTEPVRADRLRKRIMQETKILLILDNIWKDPDLAAVGIPFGNNHVGCKLLLTSSDMDLLKEMDSKNNFLVDVLEEEEACNLFMKIAGVGEEHGLRSSAFDVAKACGGLLVAIFTVAKALKNKEKCDWDTALRKLNNPPSFENVEGSVLKKAYMSIYLSYENLESEELKSTFLLCSIMACTHDASIEELFRYAVGLRLFKEENTMEDVREKAKELVRKLKDSSLLLGTRNSETFSIHDVVRDVGRWIARKDQHKFTVIDNVIPRQWADENTLQNCTSITLHDISKLPKPLECPQLQFFYMKTKTRFTKIPDNFFKGMPNLSVLHLIEMYLSLLQTSLCLLKKLQTLNLDGCHLEDIAEMKDMENLEILVIGFRSDKQLLPEEIGQLTSLRVLDLRNCSFIIPPKTISRLTQLEELYMGDWYDQREVEASVASLEELKDLYHLTALHIRVADAEILPKGLDFFQNLKRYKIVIGEHWYTGRETSRTLHVTSDTNIRSEDGVIKQLKGIEDLHLGGKQRVKNVLYELDGEGFPQLKHFCMEDDPYIQLIVDSIPSATCEAFPLLETLSLYNLVWLEKICHDQLRAKCFCQLTTIFVQECGKLKNLFSFTIAKHLSKLKRIGVVDCGNMEEIFSMGRIDDVNNNEVIDVVCDQLHSLTLQNLPRLRRICSESGIASTSQERLMPLTTDASEEQVDAVPLFGEKAFSNLEKVTIYRNHVRIICQSSYPEDLFPNLEFLEVTGDKSAVFPLDILVRFHNLKKLQLTSSWYKEIFSFEEVEKHARLNSFAKMDLILQKLEFLQVHRCGSLIILMPPSASFENLKILKVYGCNRLLSLVVASTAKSLVLLEEMSIKYCEEMTEIITNEGDVLEGEIIFRRLKSLELEGLFNLTCFCYGNYTLNFPLLEKLKMEYCPKMQFFSSGVVRTPKLQQASQVSQNWTNYVWECDNLNTFIKQHREKEVFLKSSLSGHDIRLVRQIFPEQTKVFSNAKQLNLNGNDIRMIWQSQFPGHIFPKVKCLHVSKDESKVFTFGIFQIFHNVAKLDLTSSSYKEIFQHEEVQKHEGELPQIKRLRVIELHDLEQMWKPNSKLDLILINLEILEVKRCKSLINVLLPSSSFENLKILKVEGCERLISLVAASTAKCMVQLEEMQICRCKMMTEVVANEGDITEEDKIIFHKLKKLELNDLSSLTSFSSGNYTFKIPVLEKLNVEECPNIMIFSSRDLNTPMLREVWQDETEYTCENDLNKIVQQHHEEMVFTREKLNFESIRIILQKFVEHQKVFSNLEQLSFSRDEIRMLLQSQFPQHLFPKLELLEVSGDESIVFQLAILERFQNVKRLELNYGSYEEILSCEEVEKHARALSRIKSLLVYRLDDLKQMWKQDSKMDLNLQNLENLQVEWCGSLVTLMPPSASFQNLTRMSVEGCHRLMCFLAPSTAKSLVRLKYMTIKKCNMMTEVISSNEGAETRDEIIFKNLWHLELDGLSSLTSFCSGKYTFNFPRLEILTMKKWPKIKFFSSGVLNTPKLHGIQHDSTYYTLDGDLNATIHGIHEKLNTKTSTEDCAGPSALSPSSSAI